MSTEIPVSLPWLLYLLVTSTVGGITIVYWVGDLLLSRMKERYVKKLMELGDTREEAERRLNR